MNKKELVKYLIEYHTIGDVVDISSLDFSDYDVSVDISDLKVSLNLYQHLQTVGKDLHQDLQKVQGEIYQDTYKEMTKEEIEKELGYKIKIKEENE